MQPEKYAAGLQRLAMLSNFSTSYNVVNISLVLPIFRILYYPTEQQQNEAALASSLLVGMMIGQVLGGILGDAVGRLRALQCVMLLQMLSSFASATASWKSLTVWRCLLGMGAGGVYPLAAVLSAEQKDDNDLHRVVLTFATQGLGFWMVPAVGCLLLWTCSNLEIVWRVLLGLGALPGILLVYLQWKLHKDTSPWGTLPHEEQSPGLWQGGVPPAEPRNTTEDDSDGEETTVLDSTAASTVQPEQTWWESVRSEPNLFQKLVGTAVTWFLFDVLFYGNTLFQPIVLEAAFGNKGTDALASLRQTARDSLLLSSIALPGYAVAAWLMGREDILYLPSQTPRYVMLQGFACMAVLYLIIGLFWDALKHTHPSALLLLYGLTFFFANYGPNTTTFVLPSRVYSESCRSSLNGISAAAGKLGAWTGASLFAPAAYHWGNAAVMLVCAVVAVVAFFLTQAFVPAEYHAVVMEGDGIVRMDMAAAEEEETEVHDDDGVDVEEL